MTTSDVPEPPAPDLRTIADLPFHVMGRFQTPIVLARVINGEVVGVTGQELFERVRDLSLGLGTLGMRPGDRIGVISESRPEWLTVDLAVLAAGAVTVPVYPTLAASQVAYILRDAGTRLVVVSTWVQAEKVLSGRGELPGIETIVCMDAADVDPASGVLTLDDVITRGHEVLIGSWGVARAFRDAARAVTDDQLATIIYTSGTTGHPKGVMLTHRALVANLRAAAAVLFVGPDDVALSFLPLSHAFERMVAFVYLYSGVTIVFAETMDTVARDIGIVRPSVITGVPRVYEKFQARIREKGLSGPRARAALFKWATDVGTSLARRRAAGHAPGALAAWQSRVADRLVFRRIREGLGGRIRLLVSGSAPLAPEQAIFFSAIGLPITEGYGLTETAPAVAVNPQGAPRLGTVGRPLPGVDVRIAPDGEILVRGANLMTGYYNRPDDTADVLRDGWLHTGDIGALDADGYLSILDRKKDLMVTSGGKKVAPQPTEARLKRSPLVAEAMLLGERRRFVSALIIPDFATLSRQLAAAGQPAGADREALVRRPDVVALYEAVVADVNRDLAQFERIKKIALLPCEFTVESGELTPSLKVKRRVVEERERARIDEMYRDA